MSIDGDHVGARHQHSATLGMRKETWPERDRRRSPGADRSHRPEASLFTRNEECIAALRKELEASKCDALAYDDKLVQDFVEKIEVFPEMMRFTMKTGMVTEVAM